MAAHDPEKRREVAAAGGRARKAKANPAALAASGRAGALAANAAPALARRIEKLWPTVSRAERAEVWKILGPLMPRPRANVSRSDDTDQGQSPPHSAR